MIQHLVSIVIRCYNEQDHIGRLLTGVFEQSMTNIQVILVDSGSTDQTLSIASKFPVLVRKISPEDFSFGRALNIGCQAARSELLVFASAHVYPLYRDWLEQITAPFSSPKVALVYGKQRGATSTKYAEHQIFAKWFPDGSNPNQNHPFCNNANAAIRRSLWERQPYDETLTGLEDIDWAKRAMQLGYKIAYVSKAEVVHVHEESPRRVYNRYRREAMALKRIFPQERFTLWDFIRLFASNVATDCYHAWHDRELWRHLTGIVTFRFMQFWGTFRGYAQRGFVTSQLREMFYYPNGWSRIRSNTVLSETRPLIRYSNPHVTEQ
jgi:glycosyltransferase involved in cell wall biosynthesis